jgi:hypothetical protein
VLVADGLLVGSGEPRVDGTSGTVSDASWGKEAARDLCGCGSALAAPLALALGERGREGVGRSPEEARLGSWGGGSWPRYL